MANKPPRPPTNALIPAGSECGKVTDDGGLTIGCYEPDRHHIRRLDAFLSTLLHEVAHALAVGDPTMIACNNLADNDAYQACVHGDIFRCAADHLYTTYANIPTAGVCGTAPEPTVSTGGDTVPTEWSEPSWTNDGARFGTWVNHRWHDRAYPYENDNAWLTVECSDDGLLSVYLLVGNGYLAANVWTDRIKGGYVFLPAGFFGWNRLDQEAWYSAYGVANVAWIESTDNKRAFLPDHFFEGFLNAAADDEHAYVDIWLEQFDGTWFGSFFFPTTGSHQHIRTVTEACGWTWS